MDPINEKYKEAAQNQLQHIDNVAAAFRQKCEELKNSTEQQIAALDPKTPELTNQINMLKLKLKQDLDVVVSQFEKEMKRSFNMGLVSLEDIYHQKELMRLAEIEREVLTY